MQTGYLGRKQHLENKGNSLWVPSKPERDQTEEFSLQPVILHATQNRKNKFRTTPQPAIKMCLYVPQIALPLYVHCWKTDRVYRNDFALR